MTSHNPDLTTDSTDASTFTQLDHPLADDGEACRAREAHRCQPGTSAWEEARAMTVELIHQVLNEDLIAIDIGDAAELALTCEHLCGWLSDASSVVIDSLHGFGGADVGALIGTLDRLAAELSRAFPSVSPHRVTGSAAPG